ncbi:hypothetical protein L484_004416 [Morus notabilis]|uniref:Uncharacterized protein n=1 Tax=Morus notabilis TaxID=981085 RepID=W9RJ65_9ROSA|nr:protein FAM32A [Morus notabilis]EXB94225.1 hypothetical protein L484_004416 [Morus notabilis]
MLGYENVVGGRLKLKGKALDVKKDGGINIKKKKKKQNKKKHIIMTNYLTPEEVLSQKLSLDSEDLLQSMNVFEKRELRRVIDGDTMRTTDDQHDDENDIEKDERQSAAYDSYLTPAERRYLQQWEKLDCRRLAKMASKSHHDRIQEFNQYLANLSEHYDILKVGPG